MASLILMTHSSWNFLPWMNLNWHWPVVVGDFTLKFIASSRLLILRPNICFSVSGGKMLRMTAILSCAVILAVHIFRMSFPLSGFAPIFPDTCYHLTHYWPAAVDIPVASDNPVHYADAIRYNARTPLQGSLLPLTRLV
ncbi:putative transposase-like protein [Klebsiella pneumoniae]|uniref:Putative transposase-like protein n=1 Tax=Klebsiella pneumoniae TaxID=573 RepID=A0A377X6H8_KLEPN|nr:putative transposase-like protein [Klebsiella pneumoniae]STV69143.1 putative transposase-like protein [Klebsiella pneumoniae subsp. rhinoscleromatis]STT82365.1 putative transposase-like protein [Klebsiella pneumoniae]STU10048.1 putative transposase-like protein [Klebsiella pneumoniae]STW10927.1 putative transposase-like protein [Klebsiella pneumoniae subsp. rhinoscleromatis]